MFSSFFDKIKVTTAIMYDKIKTAVSNIKLPKPNPNVEVSWDNDGQPQFKDKTKKSKKK